MGRKWQRGGILPSIKIKILRGGGWMVNVRGVCCVKAGKKLLDQKSRVLKWKNSFGIKGVKDNCITSIQPAKYPTAFF